MASGNGQAGGVQILTEAGARRVLQFLERAAGRQHDVRFAALREAISECTDSGNLAVAIHDLLHDHHRLVGEVTGRDLTDALTGFLDFGPLLAAALADEQVENSTATAAAPPNIAALEDTLIAPEHIITSAESTPPSQTPAAAPLPCSEQIPAGVLIWNGQRISVEKCKSYKRSVRAESDSRAEGDSGAEAEIAAAIRARAAEHIAPLEQPADAPPIVAEPEPAEPEVASERPEQIAGPSIPRHLAEGAVEYRRERDREDPLSNAPKAAARVAPMARPDDAATQQEFLRAFTFLGDTSATAPKEIIKGLVPAEGIAVTGGQSTAGKTFIEIHKAICLERGLPFFGYKIAERVGTAFVAAEGRSSIPNRFAAALMATDITEKLAIALLNEIPEFSTTEGIKLFIQRLKALDERFQGDFGVRLGQVTIDTVAASFGMKDEDDNAEATKVCNVMRRISEATGALMSAVHHYGKDPLAGLRGASAWKGSSDVVLGVLAEINPLSGKASDRELVCIKERDGEQGPISPFELEFVRLGLDEDGDVFGSCYVVPTRDGKSRFDKAAKLSKSARAVQDAITEVLDGRGKTITPRPGMGPVLAALVTDVRAEFDQRYVVDEADPAKAAETKRKAFRRALDRLSTLQFGAGSAEGADWIWRAQ